MPRANLKSASERKAYIITGPTSGIGRLTTSCRTGAQAPAKVWLVTQVTRLLASSPRDWR